MAIGIDAYNASDTENDNIAIGFEAMTTNTAGGTANVAIGNYALDALTSGDNNAGVGGYALTNLSTGGNNAAFGYLAGSAATDSSKGTFIGASAGVENTTGTGNTYVGYQAGKANTTGSNNVAVGVDSAYYGQGRPITGSENTYVGARTNIGRRGASFNQIVIGFEGRPSQSADTSTRSFPSRTAALIQKYNLGKHLLLEVQTKDLNKILQTLLLD